MGGVTGVSRDDGNQTAIAGDHQQTAGNQMGDVFRSAVWSTVPGTGGATQPQSLPQTVTVDYPLYNDVNTSLQNVAASAPVQFANVLNGQTPQDTPSIPPELDSATRWLGAELQLDQAGGTADSGGRELLYLGGNFNPANWNGPNAGYYRTRVQTAFAVGTGAMFASTAAYQGLSGASQWAALASGGALGVFLGDFVTNNGGWQDSTASLANKVTSALSGAFFSYAANHYDPNQPVQSNYMAQLAQRLNPQRLAQVAQDLTDRLREAGVAPSDVVQDIEMVDMRGRRLMEIPPDQLTPQQAKLVAVSNALSKAGSDMSEIVSDAMAMTLPGQASLVVPSTTPALTLPALPSPA